MTDGKFKRQKSGKTDYRKRLKALLSRKTRFTVRRALNTIRVQATNYNEKGDNVVASAVSTELRKLGWKGHTGNLPAAYLTGALCAKKALEKGIKDGVLDIGYATPVKNSAVFAAARGIIDGGVAMPAGIEMDASQYNGQRIAEYAKTLEKEAYSKQFSAYVKNGFKPEDLPKNFEEVAKKLGLKEAKALERKPSAPTEKVKK